MTARTLPIFGPDTRCPVCNLACDGLPGECGQCGQLLTHYWRTLLRPWRAYQRARDAAESRQWAEAGREACLAVSLEPERWEFRWLFSFVLYHTQELDAAIAEAQAAFALRPDHAELQRWVRSLLEERFQVPKLPT